MHMNISVGTQVHICAHTTCINMHTQAYACIPISSHMSVRMSMHVCVCVCAHTESSLTPSTRSDAPTCVRLDRADGDLGQQAWQAESQKRTQRGY